MVQDADEFEDNVRFRRIVRGGEDGCWGIKVDAFRNGEWQEPRRSMSGARPWIPAGSGGPIGETGLVRSNARPMLLSRGPTLVGPLSLDESNKDDPVLNHGDSKFFCGGLDPLEPR